jgi:ribosomal protein L7/L12
VGKRVVQSTFKRKEQLSMVTDDDDLNAELLDLLAAGQKLEAIKRYREATGAGLAAAKDAVEALERGEDVPAGEPADSALEEEVVALLGQGRKIDAIKLYRRQTGADLKGAKEAVEEIGVRRQVLAPSGSGCLGVLLFVAVGAIGLLKVLTTS